jgi:ABC-2 type transport system permease protein
VTTAPSQSKALRRIYLTIFLRGRAARGIQKDKTPKSIASKLALTLIFYAAFGLFAAYFTNQSLFALSIYLHASTLIFMGMFVASSAGEALFNKEEADILLHRPVTARAMLWAKVSVIVQIALWLAISFNLAGFVIGSSKAGWRFPLAHGVSLAMEALFCVGLVVVTYQLCLRWFGRERLDGLITTMQTVMSIAIVAGSQLAPQYFIHYKGQLGGDVQRKWILLLPPAWFAGFDDALAGNGDMGSWVMAGIAAVATGIVLWAGFGTLAGDYGAGLQTLQESAPARSGRRGRKRWVDRLVHAPPLRWWLRDSVTRAGFLLSTAYLARDRDVKLRVYPGLAPMLMMPIIFLLPSRGRAMGSEFGVAFAGTYLGLLPMLGLGFLKYSQQWQAADVFRAAPIPGPAALCHGARKAVLCFIALPVLLVLGCVTYFLGIHAEALKMLLPGIIALPVFAIVPCLKGDAVPLSQAPEEARQANRGLQMIGVMLMALVLAGLSMLARSMDLFWWFLLLEAAVSVAVYILMYRRCAKAKWEPMD